jgi:tetratricopeptide (TPR) repeat protein
LAGLALVLPPLAILIGGIQWFCVRDPIQWKIATVVSEGLPVTKMGLLTGWRDFARYVAPPLFLFGFTLAVVCWRKLQRTERMLLLWSLLVTVPIIVSAVLQNRWIVIFSAVSLPAFVGAVTLLPRILGARVETAVLILTGATLIGIMPAHEISLVGTWLHTSAGTLPEEALYPVFMRHVAQALRARSGPGDVTVLASPNDSVMLIYYGGFHGIGTLYWENNAGIKATAEIYASKDIETARRLIAARGIRYLVASSKHHFIDGYYYLATGSWDRDALSRSFASQVFIQGNLPLWLRPVRIPTPPDLPGNLSVLVYEYVPDQTPVQFWFNSGNNNFENGYYAQAVRNYEEFIKLKADDATVLVKYAMALAETGRPVEAEAAFARAGPLAPTAEWGRLHFEFADHLRSHGDYPRAMTHYETAIRLSPDNPAPLNNLAWMLATASDARIRNGNRATELAWRAARLEGGPSAELYDTLAAAQAEAGNFPLALSTAQQAIALARTGGKPGLATEIETRLRLYQQGQAFRLAPTAPTAAK